MSSTSAVEDSVAVAGAELRGTVEPIPRRSTLVERSGRVLLFPIYAATRVLTWPTEKGAVLYDQQPWVRTLFGVFGGGLHVGGVDVSAFANYQTGESFAEVGLEAVRRDWLGEDGKARLRVGWLDEDKNVFDVKLQTPPARGGDLALHALVDSKSGRGFYGVGAASDQDEAPFDCRRLLLEASAGVRWLERGSVRLTGYARDLDLTLPDDLEDDERDIREEFPELWPRSTRSDYLGLEMSLAWDTRDDDVRSTRGGLLRVVYGVDESRTQEDSDYTHGSFEVQRFIDLYRGTRILSLRAFTGAVWADDLARLPFTELERTGGRFGARGYPRLRFADARQLVLTAEYLYRATELVRGKVFVDWGSVAGDFESLRPFATDASIGFGLDVGRRKRVSLQAAWSPEGIEFSFGSDTLFSERTRREQ